MLIRSNYRDNLLKIRENLLKNFIRRAYNTHGAGWMDLVARWIEGGWNSSVPRKEGIHERRYKRVLKVLTCAYEGR